MLLREISYMLLEQIRSHRIIDDEEIDLRLVDNWIITKRADILKNKGNQGYVINTNNTQVLPVSVSRVTTSSLPQHKYPYADLTVQQYYIYKSTTEVPKMIWNKCGPIILEMASSDKLKLPYSVVPYSRLRFSGNGRFNTNLIFAAIDADNYLYLSDKSTTSYLASDSTVYTKAIFENPADVNGFDMDTTEFPVSLDIVEAIKASVFDREFKVAMNAPEANESNDANDEN